VSVAPRHGSVVDDQRAGSTRGKGSIRGLTAGVLYGMRAASLLCDIVNARRIDDPRPRAARGARAQGLLPAALACNAATAIQDRDLRPTNSRSSSARRSSGVVVKRPPSATYVDMKNNGELVPPRSCVGRRGAGKRSARKCADRCQRRLYQLWQKRARSATGICYCDYCISRLFRYRYLRDSSVYSLLSTAFCGHLVACAYDLLARTPCV